MVSGVRLREVTCVSGSSGDVSLRLFLFSASDGATLTPLSTQTTSNSPGVGLRTPWEVSDFLLLCTFYGDILHSLVV